MVDKLVSVAWVAEHGGDAGVRLVEVDVDTEAYIEGHIAGAVGWSWTSQLQDQTRRDIIAQDALEALLGQSGIANDTHVVLYGDNSNWFAAYALWLLELYGHDAVSLMDGGRIKWVADGRPLTAALPVLTRATYAAKPANAALRAKAPPTCSRRPASKYSTTVPMTWPSYSYAAPEQAHSRIAPVAVTIRCAKWRRVRSPARRVATRACTACRSSGWTVIERLIACICVWEYPNSAAAAVLLARLWPSRSHTTTGVASVSRTASTSESVVVGTAVPYL